jgi:DIS3-like exonuclease 1
VDALDTEVAAVLVENEISVPPFSAALLASMPKNTPQQPWAVTDRDVAERLDLRTSHLIFSIDPKGSEDIDDALSVVRLPGGRVELGVHIADVSAFVTPGSLADLEARARGTTVYLADRRFNMLPPVLSEDLCSLRGGQDRFAVSVLAQIGDDGDVVATWFGRTLIRSARELYYEQAQAILDAEDGLSRLPDAPASLRKLHGGGAVCGVGVGGGRGGISLGSCVGAFNVVDHVRVGRGGRLPRRRMTSRSRP